MDPKSPTGLPDAKTPAREPSGIMAVKTGFQKKRPGRKRSRPTTRSLLVLFVLILVGAIGATIHRRVLESEFETRVARSQATPYEIKRIRQELADLEVDQKTLAGALDARLKRVEAAKRNEFYVSIDTKRKTLSFRFADKTLRDAPVEVGPPQTIVAGKKKWTFAPLSGSFNVAGKYQDQGWRVPEWAYLRNDLKPPRTRPTVKNGLGKYVILLGNDYVIHSPPSPESPLKGAKPGSFMVPEADLAAIWPRVGPETRVYVF